MNIYKVYKKDPSVTDVYLQTVSLQADTVKQGQEDAHFPSFSNAFRIYCQEYAMTFVPAQTGDAPGVLGVFV